MSAHRSHDEITIRLLTEADGPALARLAQRDSAPTPSGRVLGALSGGELLAALSLSQGTAVADPFAPTSELRSLLDRRAAQLRGRDGGRAGGLRRLLSRRSRAALPASPPGGGGRLLTLPPEPCG